MIWNQDTFALTLILIILLLLSIIMAASMNWRTSMIEAGWCETEYGNLYDCRGDF